MYSASDLTAEISRVILELDETKQRKNPNWITQEVMSKHPLPAALTGDEADFVLLCERAHVYVAVTRLINRAKVPADGERDPQMAFAGPGYERLQREYLIDEEGVEVAVPVEQMTDEQLMQKVQELRAMAVGCNEHADEILRYIEERSAERKKQRRGGA
jgi:hypothetical protein